MKTNKIIIFVISLLAFVACEKASDSDKKLYLKSVNLLSEEVIKYYYNSNKQLIRIDVRKEPEDNVYYYSKYDLFYKETGKLDRLVERAIDTTLTSPNGPLQIQTTENVSIAYYNLGNNFCGVGTSANTFTIEFSSNNKLISRKNSDREEYFEYDDIGNLSTYSYYYQGNLSESRVYEYDNKKSPYYNFYPYWGIGESNWPLPISKTYAFLSPNNLTKLTSTHWSTTSIISLQYKYNELGYPAECTYKIAGESDVTYTYHYY